jgi:hypothetical protein
MAIPIQGQIRWAILSFLLAFREAFKIAPGDAT